MKNKGLCTTCIFDKSCSFIRKFPVLQCEEFSTDELKPRRKKKEIVKK